MPFWGSWAAKKLGGLDIGSGIIKLSVIDHWPASRSWSGATTEVAADAIVRARSWTRPRVGGHPGAVLRGWGQAAVGGTAVGGRDVIVKKSRWSRMKEGTPER